MKRLSGRLKPVPRQPAKQKGNPMSHLNPQSRFTELFAILGQPENGRAVSADTLEKYRGKLPDRLLEYWQEYGFCRFANGLFG